jgi:tetratricopeptide (TPR) repeat protein
LRAPRIAVLAASCWLVASCAATEPEAPPAAEVPAAAPAPSAAVPVPVPSAPNDEPTRERMADIFAAMRFLLPLSLDPQAFEDPTRRQAIRDALSLLDESAESLARHGASREVSFAHLARSLAIDARDAHDRYEQGHVLEVRYLVQTITETCVACHSRLPATSDAPRSEAFMDDAMVETLPRERRARLAYATRQFDEAVSLYEALLADSSFPANDIDQENQIDDYLELAIRVRGEPRRALDTLKRFATRQDLTPAFRGGVQRWIESLQRLVARGPVTSPVAVARAEIDQAVAAGRTGLDDRRALVEYLDASALLHRHLVDARPPHSDQAEAYYLLGVIETRIGRTFWLSQAEAYLETAIRLAPGEPVAKDAYALLEEYLGAGYSGAAGANLPSDVREKLALLRRISEGEVPAAVK